MQKRNATAKAACKEIAETIEVKKIEYDYANRHAYI